MRLFRDVFLILLLAVMLTACATTPENNQPKVHCPACGTDFDALYQKRF